MRQELDLATGVTLREPHDHMDLSVVCLFSLLGLTLSAAVLSFVSSESINQMLVSFG